MDPLSTFDNLKLKVDDRDAVNPFDCISNEVLELIFSHLRPKFLIQNVLLVCSRFYGILSSEERWYRCLQSHPLNIQLCEEELNSSDFSALRTLDTIVTEEMCRKNWNEKERYTTASNSGFVSSVKLFKGSGRRYCLSAEQNSPRHQHSIKLWSLDKMQDDCTEDDSLLFECNAKTYGLCFKIAIDGNKQFAANYYNAVKLWDIGESSIREICTRQLYSGEFTGVMFMHDRFLACATSSSHEERTNRFSLLDVRNGLKEIALCNAVPRLGNIVSLHLKDNTIHILFDDQLFAADIRKLD